MQSIAPPPTERTLPHNDLAEQATLGAILLDRDAIIPIADWLRPDHFYSERHARIFAAQLACYQRRQPPDLAVVADELRRRDQLDAIGGVPFLIDLSNAVPTAWHVEYYARIVERTGILRRLIQAGGQIAALGFDEAGDVDATLASAQRLLLDVAAHLTQTGMRDLEQIGDELISEMDAALSSGKPVALQTPWVDLNKAIGGLRRKELIVLTSPSGTGKSTMMGQLLSSCARGGGHAGVFSLEMKNVAILKRILADLCKLPYAMLRDHRYSTDYERFQASKKADGAKWLADLEDTRINTITQARYELLPTLRISMQDVRGLSIDQIRLQALKKAAQSGPFDLLAVDYAQLAKPTRRHGTREQEVAEIADGLLELCDELDCPVLALAQQNENGDVRESRRLYNNCHVELRLQRRAAVAGEAVTLPIVDLLITKARDGEITTEPIPLVFDGAAQRFTSFAGIAPEGY